MKLHGRTVSVPRAATPAAAALLDLLAPRLDPSRRVGRCGSDRPGVLLARVRSDDGRWTERAWFAGGLRLDDVEEAVAASVPLAVLVRTAPGGERTVYALAAAARRLAFLARLDGLGTGVWRLPHPRLQVRLSIFRFEDRGRRLLVAAPPVAELFAHLDALAGRDDVAVTTPRRLAAALEAATVERTMAEARDRLARMDPDLSCRPRPRVAERAALVAAIAGAPAMLWLWPSCLSALVQSASAAAFMAVGYVRARAVTHSGPAGRPPRQADAALPPYTVLVPLRREAAMVPGLVKALEVLDYPADRLEIRFLLEADDAATVAAVDRAIAGRPTMRRSICPPGGPRTKPRALCLGLAFATGELVTVYDAEDRPHPRQLRAAAAAFGAGPPDLACVQARLEVDRIRNGLQRQFAIEYAILFEGVLPWLAGERLPLPLGGTSNHFRRAALDAVHGWDPWNVTEDADLGIRLVRYGYSVDMLDSVTREEAPATLRVWMGQRRRWIKGWMVTWLVHGPRVRTLAREIGWRSALMFHVHGFATIGAPLFHPVGLGLVGLHLAGLLPIPGGPTFAADVLAAASLSAFALGYGASLVLARSLLARRGRRDLMGATWLMPFYWLLVSWAAWTALAELLTRPHHWAKTPHDPFRGDDGGTNAGSVAEGGAVERVKGIEPSS